MIAVIQAIVGLVLLTMGKRLFWFFVGAIGFVVALWLATRLFEPQSELVLFAIAVGAGFLGALLAQFAQRLAVGVAGFVAGGYLAVTLLTAFGVELGPMPWPVFLFGGLLGALLSYPLFDTALIVLSALTGAVVLIQALELASGLALALTLVLALLGVAIQAGWFRRLARRRPA